MVLFEKTFGALAFVQRYLSLPATDKKLQVQISLAAPELCGRSPVPPHTMLTSAFTVFLNLMLLLCVELLSFLPFVLGLAAPTSFHFRTRAQQSIGTMRRVVHTSFMFLECSYGQQSHKSTVLRPEHAVMSQGSVESFTRWHFPRNDDMF